MSKQASGRRSSGDFGRRAATPEGKRRAGRVDLADGFDPSVVEAACRELESGLSTSKVQVEPAKKAAQELRATLEDLSAAESRISHAHQEVIAAISKAASVADEGAKALLLSTGTAEAGRAAARHSLSTIRLETEALTAESQGHSRALSKAEALAASLEKELAEARREADALAAATQLPRAHAETQTVEPAEVPSFRAVPTPAADEGAEAASTTALVKVDPILNPADPGPFLVQRAAQRLNVSSTDVPALNGEFKLVQGEAHGRPAYKSSGAHMAFLMWTPQEGGGWIFTSGGADASGVAPVVARSNQLAWTALPDELMSTSWTKACFGEEGDLITVVILRA